MTEEVRKFYRIVRSAQPTEQDFWSAMRLGKPLRDLRFEREWREGISVFDDLGYAREAARKLRGRIGEFVVMIEIPPDGSASYRKTMRDPHHFTVYGPPEVLRSLVRGEAIAIDELGRRSPRWSKSWTSHRAT